MQIVRFASGIRGFTRLADYAIRVLMVTDKATHKARVLAFWEKWGLAATVEAFGISRRSLYLWKRQRTAGGGRLEALNERSTRPRRVRRRAWPPEVPAQIRRLRTEHPNLGPEKVAILLRAFCTERHLPAPAARTVARIIAEAPDRMRLCPVRVRRDGRLIPRTRVRPLRKPAHFVATHPGHCGAFDTIERFIEGHRRYIITFTDLYSRFGLAWATTSHASQAARGFFLLVRQVFPYPLDHVLTDNGSEFMKHFDHELRRCHQAHWHTYPKTPKMNAHEERFNRTLQEEFVDFHEDALLEPERFNEPLLDYLLWFNGERPHWALGLKSPIQFLTAQNPECKMWWHNTRT